MEACCSVRVPSPQDLDSLHALQKEAFKLSQMLPTSESLEGNCWQDVASLPAEAWGEGWECLLATDISPEVSAASLQSPPPSSSLDARPNAQQEDECLATDGPPSVAILDVFVAEPKHVPAR